jgi:hypothetical protein
MKFCFLILILCVSGWFSLQATATGASRNGIFIHFEGIQRAMDTVPATQDEFALQFDTTAVPEDNLTKLIRELLAVTHTRETDLEMGTASLMESLGMQDSASVTPLMKKFCNEMIQEFRQGRIAKWLELVYIRNYRKLFTEEEIRGLISFYQSPLGKKSLERTKVLMKNVMTDARKIGQFVGQDVMTRLLESDKNH